MRRGQRTFRPDSKNDRWFTIGFQMTSNPLTINTTLHTCQTRPGTWLMRCWSSRGDRSYFVQKLESRCLRNVVEIYHCIYSSASLLLTGSPGILPQMHHTFPNNISMGGSMGAREGHGPHSATLPHTSPNVVIKCNILLIINVQET